MIRRLSAADVEDYRTIRLATLETEPDFFGSVYADVIKRPIDDFAAAITSAAIFGAYSGDRIAGVIRLDAKTGVKERHKGSIHGFFVSPEYRRMGLGAALMSTVVETARQSLEQLTLGVAASNRGAIGLYERFGFKQYGIEPLAYKHAGTYTDLVLMVLLLSPVQPRQT